MIAGFAATVLILYNGIIDKPGSGPGEIAGFDKRVIIGHAVYESGACLRDQKRRRRDGSQCNPAWAPGVREQRAPLTSPP